jgi:predicted nuclease with TOPRIM domain
MGRVRAIVPGLFYWSNGLLMISINFSPARLSIERLLEVEEENRSMRDEILRLYARVDDLESEVRSLESRNWVLQERVDYLQDDRPVPWGHYENGELVDEL